MKTQASVHCPLCGEEGRLRHEGQGDRLFGASGSWSFWKCGNPSCGILWLNPRPIDEDLGLAYETYFTHASEESEFPSPEAEAPEDRKRKNDPATRILKALLRLIRDPFRWAKKALNGLGIASGRLNFLARYRAALAAGESPSFFNRAFTALLPGAKSRLDFEFFYMPVRHGARLLDVGCGGGDHVQRLSAMGWKAEGTEVDPKAVAAARSKGLTVHQGMLETLGLELGSFNSVVACHVVEHVPDPEAFVRSAFGLLASGGTLVVITPNRRSLGHRIFGRAWLHLDPPRHLHIHTPESLRSLASGLGASHVEVETTVRDISNSYAASWDILRTGRHEWGRGRSRFSALIFKTLALTCGWSALLVPSFGEELVLKVRRGASGDS